MSLSSTSMQAPVSDPPLALCDGLPGDSNASVTHGHPQDQEEPPQQPKIEETNDQMPDDTDMLGGMQRLGDALHKRDGQKLSANPKIVAKKPAMSKAGVTSAKQDDCSSPKPLKKPSAKNSMKKPGSKLAQKIPSQKQKQGSPSKGSPKKKQMAKKPKENQKKKMTPKDVYSRAYHAEKRFSPDIAKIKHGLG